MEYFYYRLYIKEGFFHADYDEYVIKIRGLIEYQTMFLIKIRLWFRTHHLMIKIYDYEPISEKEYEEELIFEKNNF